MTQEDKQLLLKDLSARLSYGVILNCCNSIGEKLTSIDENGLVNHDYDIEEVKPYLFPLESMTGEQYDQLYIDSRVKNDSVDILDALTNDMDAIDWLNEHHFDYRNLIMQGLAMDCTNLNIY